MAGTVDLAPELSGQPATAERDAVLAVARAAKDVAPTLATATRATKDAALLAMADALDARADDARGRNAEDVARAVPPAPTPHWSTG